MTIRGRAALLLAAALAALAGPGGCGDGPSTADPGGPHVLRATLRDASTGDPVPRTGLYVHLFCDDLRFQRTLPASDAAEFRAGMPGPRVRIRVHDPAGIWEPLEQTVAVEKGEAVLDLRLRPTGYILLRGSVIDGRTGEPIRNLPAEGPPPPPGEGPLFSFLCDDPAFSVHFVVPDADGRYAVRVPRARIRIGVVDTALAPETPEVVLSGEKGPVRDFDIVLR